MSAREHHGVAAVLQKEALNFGERLRTRLGRDRDVEVGDAVPLHEAAQIIVIGDDAWDFKIEFLVAPAIQQVGEAVILLADEHHDAFLTAESLTCHFILNSPAIGENFSRKTLMSNGSESARICWRMKNHFDPSSA